MQIHDIQAAMEAVLFAAGEPLTPDKIAEAVGLDIATAKKLLDDFAQQLNNDRRGVELLVLDGKYQLCTKAKFAPQVRKALEIRRNTPLSQAAMEVLAIIAYNQPVTRAFVDQIRGVDSAAVIAGLSNKGLIEEKGRLELPGRPLTYGTTDNFLRCFHISSASELPQVNRVQERTGAVTWTEASRKEAGPGASGSKT
ncbi:MAG: SMC-Scp complex subunit ScpB [Clostridia bacterium]|nr:SMC-Scp complex subunit ScpB [Clostridia bacterium]